MDRSDRTDRRLASFGNFTWFMERLDLGGFFSDDPMEVAPQVVLHGVAESECRSRRRHYTLGFQPPDRDAGAGENSVTS